MQTPERQSFLSEALRGSFDLNSEDRLTQVFVSSFNHSAKFRKYLSVFLACKLPPRAFAVAQRSFLKGSHKRPDICICAGRSTKVVLENKIEAPLTVKQLKSYSGVQELSKAKKIALVKHFFEPLPITKDWRILHWSDLGRFLERKVKKQAADTTDYFIVHNFISLLDTIGMSTPNRITKSELQHLAKAFHKMRNAAGPDISLRVPAFEVASNYIDMLEAVVTMSREEPIIRKRAAKNYQFNPRINSWWDEDEEKEHMHLSLTVEIRVKPKATGLCAVGTGLFFSNKRPGHYEFLSYGMRPGSLSFKPLDTYNANNLELDKYAKRVIGRWKKWLS